METTKIPKIDWKRIVEHNSGHTKDEWGLAQDEKIPDKMSQLDTEINTRKLIQAQNDAVIVERLKRRIDELTLVMNAKYDESDHDHYVLKELEEILGDEK